MSANVDMLSTMTPDEDQDERPSDVYETYNPLLHGKSRRRTDKIFTVEFMKKYIYLVKLLKPVLTEEATEIIADEYSKLRSEDVLENDVARVSYFIGQFIEKKQVSLKLIQTVIVERIRKI